MSDRITPPSWTEWTRSPNDRTPQRKAFDDLLGELRKEGLIEVKASLFVQLAKYSYLHVKNARIDVSAFIQGIPASVFGPIPPAYQRTEVEGTFSILAQAGLLTVLEELDGVSLTVLLTERRAAGEVARGQVYHAVLAYLREQFGRWNPGELVLRASSFPTVEATAAATGVDRAHLAPGEGCTPVQDRPESNETNPSPFLQETIDSVPSSLVLLQFWPLPDPKAPGAAPDDPELSFVIPGDLSLASLVRDLAVPVLNEFFRSNDHHDLSAQVQAKYASYMAKYREKFSSSVVQSGDRIDRVLSTTEPDSEAFANAVYVLVQVLKTPARSQGGKTTKVTLIYQAARIAYAWAMALRVRKRKDEKEAASRGQDQALLVSRLKESTRPLGLEELKRTTDASKSKELGAKYKSLIDLLPLTAEPGGPRPPVFEINGAFIHRESLIRTFLDLRDKESLSQRERLAKDWAASGIPEVEELFLLERDLSPDFLRVFELMHNERVLAASNTDFLKDFLPDERELYPLSRLIWPEGHKGGVTPTEVLVRGIDVILYEDKDRLRRRPLVGVLNLAKAYPLIVKAAWNIVYMEEGMFRFILRKIASWFGGKPRAAEVKEEAAAKKGGGGAGAGAEGRSGPDPRAQKAADLKKLRDLAPLLKDRATLLGDREKTASQWCLKLDTEAARKTRQTVDEEIFRLTPKIAVDQLSEDNGPKVALYLVEKSPVLAQVTSSRAFHRYLYLTALLRRSELLSK